MVIQERVREKLAIQEKVVMQEKVQEKVAIQKTLEIVETQETVAAETLETLEILEMAVAVVEDIKINSISLLQRLYYLRLGVRDFKSDKLYFGT